MTARFCVPLGVLSAMQRWMRSPVGCAPPSDTGLDVIIVRDGKIASLYLFLASLPDAR